MIFYYSRTHNTKTAAQALHELTGLPLYALESDINAAKGISFVWKALRGTLGSKGNKINNPPPAVPAEIYLCLPIWIGEAAGPVKYFIANTDLARTKVHAVITARMPTSQYRDAVVKLLERAGAQMGEITLLATTKGQPDPAVMHEHLREWLDGFV
jgi:hypothetical protein